METLYRLKEIGHDRIYDLQSLGMHLNGHRGIYERLRRKLNCAPGKEHFSNMTSEEEIKAAIKVLTEMRSARRKLKRNPKIEKAAEKSVRKETLSRSEEKALYRKIVPKTERERIFAEIHKMRLEKRGEIILPIAVPPPAPKRSIKSTIHTLLLRLFRKPL